jgi:hypothetical protein
MPVPLRAGERMIMHVRSTGNAKGQWQSDADIWGWPTSIVTSKHAGFGLVIVNRASGDNTPGRRVDIGGRTCGVSAWET